MFIDDISLRFENGIEWKMMSEVVSKAYPNPVADKVTIELNREIRQGLVVVYSIEGNECLRKEFTGTRADVDIAGLPPGFYQYQVIDTRTILSGGSFIVAER